MCVFTHHTSIYMYTYIYTLVHFYNICVYVYMRIFLYIKVLLYLRVHTFVPANPSMYISALVCIFIPPHIPACTFIYAWHFSYPHVLLFAYIDICIYIYIRLNTFKYAHMRNINKMVVYV